MTVRQPVVRLVVASGLLLAILGSWASSDVAGQSRPRPMPSAENGEWVQLRVGHRAARATCRSIRSTPATSASSKWPGASARHNLGPRPEFNLQGTPLMVKRHALRDRRRRQSPRDCRHRCQDRRAAVEARPRRRRACRRRAAQAFGPRPVVLDRWPRRRAHPLRHDRLSAGLAECQDRAADSLLRQGRHRRSRRSAS